MNRIVRELAFESGFASAGFEHGRPILSYEKELTKFAWLLIHECRGIALISDGNGETIAEEISQHFSKGNQ